MATENNDIVDEMEKVMNEIRANRENHTGAAFYQAMDSFQYKTLF